MLGMAEKAKLTARWFMMIPILSNSDHALDAVVGVSVL